MTTHSILPIHLSITSSGKIWPTPRVAAAERSVDYWLDVCCFCCILFRSIKIIKHINTRLFMKNNVMWNFESCFRLDSLISGLLNASDSLSENLLRTQLTEIMLERNFVGVLLTLINIKNCEWKFLSSQLIKCNKPKFQPIFRQISCYKIVFITVSVCN